MKDSKSKSKIEVTTLNVVPDNEKSHGLTCR